MTLDQLRIFVAVAEREHVTRAAKALNLTQSAVSATVSTLEERHGVRLFHRVGRGIELTETGHAFLAEARGVLARADEARRMLDDAAGLKRGHLSLVASQTIAGYWLPPILERFKACYPGVTIELAISNSVQAADRVKDGSAELGFIERPLDDPALARWRVGEDRLALIGTDLPDDPDADTLRALPWLMREKGSGTRAALVSALQDRGVTLDKLNVVLTLPSNEALLSAAASGAGVTVLSTLVAGPLLAAGTIRAAAFAIAPRPFFGLRHKERYRSKAADALLEVIG
ncbi:MAG: LysR family transcriptional regulator [Erythrobacter sp.]|nr:LysR family transcriptional regulator [Erythrobacter sp.]